MGCPVCKQMVCNSHRHCFAEYFFVQISGVAMNYIELAKEAEFSDREIQIAHDNFARFAALVAAHEREECAKICDDMDSISDYYTLRVELICAQAIRARSNT